MALCGNPACGAFIDPPQQGVPFLDRDTNRIVTLCQKCAEYFCSDSSLKYMRFIAHEGASE